MNTNLIEKELRDEFNCCNCEELLTPPIMLIATLGNLCSTCYSEEYIEKNKVTHKEGHDLVLMHEDEDNMKPPQPSIRNTALEDIMKSVRSPCENKQEGCPFIIDLTELPSHESQCEYRIIDCVVNENECKWSGSKNIYIDHLLQTEHESKVCCQPESPTLFPLDCISLGEETEDIVILKTISGICLFHYKIYAYGIKCAICRIEKESEEESFNLEFVLKNGNIMSYKCCIIDEIEMFKNFYENEECEIKFDILNALDPSKDFCVGLRHNIIGQLIRGLSGQNKISIRKDAKKLKDVLRVECDNVENGCYISPLVQEEHSRYCKYQFWNCSCDHHFGIGNAEDHFIKIHKYEVEKDYILTGTLYNDNGTKLCKEHYVNYINFFNCIFQQDINCQSDSIEFCVEKLGVNRNEKFCYEIVMSNARSTLLIRTPLSPSEPTKCSINVDLLKILFGSLLGSLDDICFSGKISPL